MASYLPSLHPTSSIFNSSDYNYQNADATYNNAVTLTGNQSVSGVKNFNSLVGINAGETVAGPLSFTSSSLPTSTATSTTTANDLLNRTVADNRYAQLSTQNSFSNTACQQSSASSTTNGNDILNRTLMDARYAQLSAQNSFANTACQQSSASSTSSGNDILNRTLMDARYPQTSGTNNFSGSNTFTTLTIPSTVSVSGTGSMVMGNTGQTGNTITNSHFSGFQVLVQVHWCTSFAINDNRIK